MSSAERERSRYERAATEAEHVTENREHLRLIIAQRSQVSAGREAWKDLRKWIVAGRTSTRFVCFIAFGYFLWLRIW